MARPPRTVRLTDNEGVEHTYRIHLHPNDEGLAITTDLLAIVGPAVGQGLFDAIRTISGDPTLRVADDASEEQKAEVEAKRGVAFQKVLTDLDPKALLQSALTTLVARGGLQALAPKLLAHTLRDNDRLDNVGALNLAYTGNYGEQINALREVIDHNGFFEALYTFLG